ncbi:type VI secretion system membrane subunit TssM [Paracoccaceae bacterium Fryx2]|nr:type VI secretion system membrane subunit TssM [Paracoccaceae bacterium Fryx2]
MMRRILRALGSAIGIVIIVGLILSACLWFLGAFLAFGEARPFDTVLGRLVGLAVLWIGLLIVILVILLTARKRDVAMAEEIMNAVDPGQGPDEVVTAELGEMRAKLKQALARLRKSKMGRKHLYELPWYVMIGPPGAGKTTAIVNSGLQFPLADEMGKTAIGGVGGTRNCDWWFTNNAVIVDTAGRYTTQESDAEADNAAWLGFLALLKKHRKRQPINGAIIAISLSDLSQQDELTQKSHAAAIRRRLHELRDKLGVRFPVYVIFTKADLIAGFTEFFEPLQKDEREQVWGFTLPLQKARGEASPIAGFDEEFGLLLGRLNAQSLERMQNESDPQRRSLIATFPMQVASVRQVARDFLSEAFQDNKFEHRQMLRGVYFASGTQEGTPIDRLMMGMARTFGIGRQAIGSGRGTGRSYFLTRLFEGVMFREAGLVSADDKVERRYRWTQRAALAGTAIMAVAAGTVWTRSYLANDALLDQTTAQIDAYRAAAAQIPGSPIGDSDLLLVVPALDILRTLPGLDPAQTGVPPGAGWGLYQGDVVGNDARQAYRASLNQHFLPRLLLRLEEQMQANTNNPDLLYETLKIYLMLGMVGPMNADLVTDWMVADWEQAYAGASRIELRATLASHLQALLAQPMQKIDLNADLVTAVQGVLTQMPQSQRVYNGIINSQAATSLPEWRLTDVGGPAIARAFVRSSGVPLNEGVEGIFTYDGFQNVFLEQALGVATQIQRDSYVLGPQGEIEQTEASLLNMSRDVLNLYFNDYVARYDQILGDLDVIPLESLSHAVEVTNVLSGPTSPILNVLTAIASETRLTEERADPTAIVVPQQAEGVVDALGTITKGNIGARLSPQNRFLLDALVRSSAAENNGRPRQPGYYVEDRFSWLQDLVAQREGQPSQLDGMLQTLTEVYQELNKLNFAGGLGTPQGDSTALARFTEAAARLPGPMQRWAAQIATGSSGITADGTRAGINARWQASVLPLCERAVGDAYPFNRRSRADISMQDFTTLFGPGGQIDTFFNENLAKFVDTRTRPWTWRKVNDTDLGMSAAVLLQMQQAAEIRDAFFAGGPIPVVKFQITPEALDPKARGIVLEIDGQQVAFKHSDGQPRPAAITWPGAVGLARVSFEPGESGSESTLSRDGPWAWYRLLDAAEIRKTNVSDRSRMIFNVGGRIAIFQMQSGSVLNPFALPALSKFSCPKSF